MLFPVCRGSISYCFRRRKEHVVLNTRGAELEDEHVLQKRQFQRSNPTETKSYYFPFPAREGLPLQPLRRSRLYEIRLSKQNRREDRARHRVEAKKEVPRCGTIETQ